MARKLITDAADGRVKSDVAELPLSYLTVDPAAQRRLDEPWARSLADKFDPDALGVITCSWRDSTVNLIHVVDGQHRVTAARYVGYQGLVRAHVYYGLTLPEEADLFRILNNRKAPSHSDLFLARCTSGDPDAIGMRSILDDNGLTVWTGGTVGTTFRATLALERAWALGRDSARAGVHLPIMAWGQIQPLVGTLVVAVAMIHSRYGDALDRARLVDVLRLYPGGQDALVSAGKAIKSTIGAPSAAYALAEAIMKAYNKGLSRTKLPNWR